jgi:hypothetical protein
MAAQQQQRQHLNMMLQQTPIGNLIRPMGPPMGLPPMFPPHFPPPMHMLPINTQPMPGPMTMFHPGPPPMAMHPPQL